MSILLFLIYINDKGCSICLFADDTSLYIIVESSNATACSLNIDLNTISTWLVVFNTGYLFTESKSSTAPTITHEQYRTNRNGHTQTPRFNTLKHMNLAQSYSSNNQKAWTILHLLPALNFRVSHKSLEHMICTYLLFDHGHY